MRAALSRVRPAQDESGTVIVLVTVMLAVLLGMAAMVIDVGRAYYIQRSLQASADAAALAGAQELPVEGVALGTARAYGGEAGAKNERGNLPPVTAEVSAVCRTGAPCLPVNAVVVKESSVMETSFARVIGIDSFTVSARATAWLRQGETPYAIFAYEGACTSKGFHFNGNVMGVEGAIHSNGHFEVNGKDVTAKYATGGGPAACPWKIDGESIDLGGGSRVPLRESRLLPWPKYFVTSDFTCDFVGEEFKFNDDGETIPTGTYCASKLFEANGNNQSGEITVLAPEIKIDGNYQRFTPHQNDVLFFATGDKEMILDGDGYDWEGIIFHPGGLIKINGNADSVLTGLIEGLEVLVNGNEFQMLGTGPLAAGKIIELVE